MPEELMSAIQNPYTLDTAFVVEMELKTAAFLRCQEKCLTVRPGSLAILHQEPLLIHLNRGPL